MAEATEFADRSDNRAEVRSTQFADRSDERTSVGAGGDLEIAVHHTTTTGVEEKLDADPMDVSFSGMKLSLATPLVFAESIKLHFVSASLKVDFLIGADVRWIRPGNDENVWHVGCAFETQLSDDWVDKLASAAGVDRRQWPRKNTKVQATVQLACNPNTFEVTLLDYSKAGLCFSSTEAVEPNQPIKVQLTDGDGAVFEIMAKSEWKRPFQSGFLIGCEVGGKHRGEFEAWRETLSTPKPDAIYARKWMWLGIFGGVLGASILALSWAIFW